MFVSEVEFMLHKKQLNRIIKIQELKLKLLEKEIISQGKYESLLLDAFRDDIVYGIDGEEEIPLD